MNNILALTNNISLLLLPLSILFSVGRNIFSKYVSAYGFGEKRFFLYQATLFSVGCVISLIFGGAGLFDIQPITLLYATIYGVLLIMAQWCYTAALKHGKTGICSTVYSLGFIFPTMSGAIFWSEKLSIINIIGIITVIPAIILSGQKNDKKSEAKMGSYIIPLLIAMLASGGLGIVQKLQQKSAYPEQQGSFIFVSFLLASAISFICSIFGKKGAEVAHTDTADKSCKLRSFLFAVAIGICFAICNILNTALAGMLPSGILFPTLNIGTIFLSMIAGVIFFKDKLTKKDFVILLLGCIAIILIGL